MSLAAADIQTRAAIFRDCFGRLKTEIGRVFVGQPSVVEQLLVCFFCQGHALLEGPPGLGKTLLVRTLSDAMNLQFARVQCTPDLMPADITGTQLLVEGHDGVRAFAFQRGPIFANIVLADEINRATPRTQSAFLEAMQERRVTVFGTTHRIDEPFSVFATQNPIEMEGTYPLPEAQLDRFFFKIRVQMPDVDDLAEIMMRTTGEEAPRASSQFSADTVLSLYGLIRQVKIADSVLRYILHLVRATHPDAPEAPAIVKKYVRYGASPRAAQSIVLASKATALLASRYHVATDDVRNVAVAALNHRIIRNFTAEMERVTAEEIARGVLSSAPAL
jgi:MoxR-like ATPase